MQGITSPSETPFGDYVVVLTPTVLDGGACAICAPGPCSCAERRRHLVDEATHATIAAWRAIERHDRTDAERQFAIATHIDASSATTWAARGLVALSLGHLGDAARSWRAAIALDETSPATEWLRSLQERRGELRFAIESYDEALSLARMGRHAEALIRVRDSINACRGFMPAMELDELLRRSGTPSPSIDALEHARAARNRQRRLMRASGVAAVVALVVVAKTVQGPTAALTEFLPPVPRVSMAARPSIATVARPVTHVRPSETLRPRFATVRDGAVETTGDTIARMYRAMTAQLPPLPSEVRSPAEQLEYGRQQLLGARRSLRQTNYDQAIAQLIRATEALRGQRYEDDALYLLALAASRQGAADVAHDAARRLLHEYPTSTLANTRMRAIAAAVTPAPR